MLAYLFPGQGSQKKGMGSDLFDRFKDYTAAADEILGYSIKSLCCEDEGGQLNQTQYTQPALYTVNALSYFDTIQTTGIKPDYVAGHSLGEYNALLAAEVFDFATGLRLVKKRGELMSQAEGGGMAAVIGLRREALPSLLDRAGLTSLSVANYNAYEQMVLTGLKTDIEKAEQVFAAESGVRYVPLPVSGAFHSPYMAKAQEAFADFLEDFHFQTPRRPVIANINARPYHPAVIKTNLTRQISQSVEWTRTIELLQSKPNSQLQEIGPGKVLTNLLQRIYAGQ